MKYFLVLLTPLFLQTAYCSETLTQTCKLKENKKITCTFKPDEMKLVIKEREDFLWSTKFTFKYIKENNTVHFKSPPKKLIGEFKKHHSTQILHPKEGVDIVLPCTSQNREISKAIARDLNKVLPLIAVLNKNFGTLSLPYYFLKESFPQEDIPAQQTNIYEDDLPPLYENGDEQPLMLQPFQE
ncbi:MAG: hypothetical protein ACJAZS_000066 [Alteromonas naphthalenivorans]|jgi:hypothetical protein